MKKQLLLVAAIATSAAALVSCNKGVVSAGKLDGAWTVTSGSIETETTTTWDDDSETTTMSYDFDGTTVEYTYDDGDETETGEMTMSMEFTFDKKTGAYTKSESTTDLEGSEYTTTYYETNDCDWFSGTGTLDVAVSTTTNTESSGIYTLTGDAGDDLEKNSQIVFQQDMWTSTTINTYTYDITSGDATDATDVYNYTWNSTTGAYECVLFETETESTYTSDGFDGEAEIWTITELKKGEMTVMYSTMSNESDPDNDWSEESTTDYNWTLTQD